MSFRMRSETQPITNKLPDHIIYKIENPVNTSNIFNITLNNNEYLQNNKFSKSGLVSLYVYLSLENVDIPPESDEVYTIMLNPYVQPSSYLGEYVTTFGSSTTSVVKDTSWMIRKYVNSGDSLIFCVKSMLGTTFKILSNSFITVSFDINSNQNLNRIETIII